VRAGGSIGRDALIRNLRGKLEPGPTPSWPNIPEAGVGYRLRLAEGTGQCS
jgi:hypothetical protein